MPTRPASFRPKNAPSRATLQREYEARRRKSKPWRALYSTSQWQTIRAAVLAAEPLCRRCTAEGLVTPATVVHHVHRHHGDPVKFFAGPFEPLCKGCHDSEAHADEMAEDAARRAGASGTIHPEG